MGKTFREIRSDSGFSLIELMIVIGIIGTLAAIAIPGLIEYREKARIARAIAEIKGLEKAIYAFAAETGRFPDNLEELAASGELSGLPTDPWGRPYQYVPVEGTPPGRLRKDRFLVPVNSDFDLYSMGQDGRSVSPFTAKHSRDDIVRCNNGGYVGLASGY